MSFLICSDSADIARLRALVDQQLQGVIDRLFAGEADLAPFAAALRYPIAAGGKRLRPILLLATVEALGGDVAAAVPSAQALELMHTFSLVHDDLPALDDDQLRRGRPTTHVVHGEDVAVLVGDGLVALAFRLLAEDQATPPNVRLAVVAELARAVDGMVRGQYLDLRPSLVSDEASLRRTCALKTGFLIQAGVRMGLALCSADSVTAAAYISLAAEIGVGFQIVDDVLDVTSTSDMLGKTVGSDVTNDRRTFVTVLGLELARERADASWATAARLLDALPGDPRALRAVVELVYQRDH